MAIDRGIAVAAVKTCNREAFITDRAGRKHLIHFSPLPSWKSFAVHWTSTDELFPIDALGPFDENGDVSPGTPIPFNASLVLIKKLPPITIAFLNAGEAGDTRLLGMEMHLRPIH